MATLTAVPWKQRRREMILGGVLAVLAILLWSQLSRSPASGLAGLSAPGGRPVDLSGLKIFDVPWGALQADRPGYDPSGRNIFQFGAIPPPPPPKLTPQEMAVIADTQRRAEEERKRQEDLLRQQETQRQQEAQRQQEIVAQQPPPPPPKPQPPAIAYRFIGYIGPPEAKIAVLHDGTDMVFARQGEVVGKGFKILEIGYESIKFGYTDAQFKGETTTLPMSSAY